MIQTLRESEVLTAGTGIEQGLQAGEFDHRAKTVSARVDANRILLYGGSIAFNDGLDFKSVQRAPGKFLPAFSAQKLPRIADGAIRESARADLTFGCILRAGLVTKQGTIRGGRVADGYVFAGA